MRGGALLLPLIHKRKVFMYKNQMKFQKIVCFAVLISCVLVFAYSLGLLTDIYDSLYPCFDPELFDDSIDLESIPSDQLSAYGVYVTGAEIYYEMQDFNDAFTKISIVMIVVSLVLFVTNTHSRRKYYIGNYIAVAIVSICNLACVFWLWPQLMAFRTQYVTGVDFNQLKEFSESTRGATVRYSDSTFWFDVSYFVFGVAILAVVLLIANLVMKIIMMNAEKKTVGTRKGVGA